MSDQQGFEYVYDERGVLTREPGGISPRPRKGQQTPPYIGDAGDEAPDSPAPPYQEGEA